MCIINSDENSMLCAKPPIDKIKDVIFSMKPTKAPAPNGYLALFYQQGCNTVKNDIFNFTISFFENPEIIRQCNLIIRQKR